MYAIMTLIYENLMLFGVTARSMRAVVAALRACRGKRDIQQVGMRIFVAVCGMAVADGSLISLLADAGGLEASVAALQDPSSDGERAIAALSTVGNLAARNPPNAARAVAASAADAVVAALRAHASESVVQVAGITALGNLIPHGAPLGPAQQHIAVAGGIEACLAAMGRFPAQLEVQHAGCFLLSNLTGVALVRAKAGALGGVEAAIRALSAGADDPRLQAAASTAIGCLAAECPANCRAAADAGGVEAVIVAITRASGPASHLQTRPAELTCCALGHLVVYTECLKRAVDGGGIEATTTALKRWPGCAEVQHAASATLAQMLIDDSAHPRRAQAVARAKAAGAPALLSAALRSHASHSGVQDRARAALHSISQASARDQTGMSSRPGGSRPAASAAAPSPSSSTAKAAQSCAQCGARPGGTPGCEKLRLCSGCRKVRYCSEECSRAAWRQGHKGECRKAAAASSTS